MGGFFVHGARKLLLADLSGGSDAGAALGGSLRELLEDATAQDEPPLASGTLAVYIICCVFLVAFSGLMAGLTLGLLSIDKMDIQVMKRSGTEREKRLVAKIEPVVAKPHFLLATLLLCNSVAMEALPLFLDRLLNPVAAIIISVTAILAFGEIVPQALCKRYGLEVGAACAWLVRGLMLATSALTWPIGELLDWVLGEHTVLFRRAQLRALVELHGLSDAELEGERSGAGGSLAHALGLGGGHADGYGPTGAGGDAGGAGGFRANSWHGSAGSLTDHRGGGGNHSPPPITHDEVRVIAGALDMATKTATAAMTPLASVFAISEDAVLDERTLRTLLARGHSRVPVHAPGDPALIRGVLLVKELILTTVGEAGKGESDASVKGGDVPGDAAANGGDAPDDAATNGGDAADAAVEPAPPGLVDGARDEGTRADRPGTAPPLARVGAPARAYRYNHPRVSEMRVRDLPLLAEDTPLYEVLRVFQQGRSHMAVVVEGTWEGVGTGGRIRWAKGIGEAAGEDLPTRATLRQPAAAAGPPRAVSKGPLGALPPPPARGAAAVEGRPASPLSCPPVLGIITIEDVIEELLQQEIVDETDEFVDNLRTIRTDVLRTLSALPGGSVARMARGVGPAPGPAVATAVTRGGAGWGAGAPLPPAAAERPGKPAPGGASFTGPAAGGARAAPTLRQRPPLQLADRTPSRSAPREPPPPVPQASPPRPLPPAAARTVVPRTASAAGQGPLSNQGSQRRPPSARSLGPVPSATTPADAGGDMSLETVAFVAGSLFSDQANDA